MTSLLSKLSKYLHRKARFSSLLDRTIRKQRDHGYSWESRKLTTSPATFCKEATLNVIHTTRVLQFGYKRGLLKHFPAGYC